tara:strand:+ start:303 stop:1055 length:753 start_codon:yes stop_codon:yes gene_type:complete
MNKDHLINSIFFPRKSDIQPDQKDHIVNVEEGVSIGIRFFTNDKKSPNILYFHGNAELAQEYDDLASYYNQYGLNLIVSDYRGYGLSTGTPNKENLLNDSLIIFDYVNTYLNDNTYTGGLIIMGRSLGCASATHIIHNKSDDIKACIIESGFATEIPFLSLMNINPSDINFKLEDGFENLKKFKQYDKPLYVIHADLDEIIPFSQADMIMIESKTTNKKLFKVEGAGHNNIISISRDHYFSNIRDFIEKL